MKLYVYNTETMEVAAIIEGETNEACENVASEQYGDTDYYGWTYTPAFGTNDGLIETNDSIEIEA